MAKQDLGKLLSQSAARSTPVGIRRGKGVGLSVEEETSDYADTPQVHWVELDHILDNPYQHAEEIDAEDFAALVESIRVDGFQGALNVSPVEGREGYYFITSGGHQRRSAAREAGLQKIPVFVAASPTEKKLLGLRLARENTAQVNRSPVNLGFLYLQLINEFGMTQEEIATAIRKDRYHVNFAIMAARSATDIRAALREKYSPRVMTYLRRVEDKEDRAPIIAEYLANTLTVEGVRVAVEQVLTEKKQQQKQQENHAQAAQAEQVPTDSATDVPERVENPLTELQSLHATDQAAESNKGTRAEAEPKEDFKTLERVSKMQAAFSRVETYRRYIEKKRADGEAIVLSDQEAMLLGKIIDRCHTLLDTYGKK